jgi:hypothetical protein
MTAGGALAELARRAGLDTPSYPTPAPRAPRPPRAAAPAVRAPGPPDPAVAELVAAAARLLWEPAGAPARAYLHGRGLADPVLAANRVGFDPGPGQLPRPAGLPRRGPGIVFPTFDPATGTVLHYQLRYLDPAAPRRYDQPRATLAANPTLALLNTPAGSPRPGLLAVCEGFPDALTAAQAGLAAAAVLGTGHASGPGADRLAHRLATTHPGAAFLLCFDDDTATDPGKLPAGRRAADQLATRLAGHGHLALTVMPPDGTKDLNAWWQRDPGAAGAVLLGTAAEFAPTPAPALTAAPPVPAGTSTLADAPVPAGPTGLELR